MTLSSWIILILAAWGLLCLVMLLSTLIVDFVEKRQEKDEMLWKINSQVKRTNYTMKTFEVSLNRLHKKVNSANEALDSFAQELKRLQGPFL